jgi:hypothetical protein
MAADEPALGDLAANQVKTMVRTDHIINWVNRYHRTKRSERKPPVRLLEAVVAPAH